MLLSKGSMFFFLSINSIILKFENLCFQIQSKRAGDFEAPAKEEEYGNGRMLEGILPVVTFVLYGGKEKWNGPECLHDMLDWTDVPEKLKMFVSDYPIHVIKIREFENTEVFQTDVKQVFDFIRCSGDRKALAELIQNDKAYQAMEEDAYEVVTQYVKADELIQVKDEYKGKDGKVNMCQALKELIEDGRAEGRASGLADGRKEIVLRMYADGNLDVEGACMYLECTQETFMEYVKADELIQVKDEYRGKDGKINMCQH